MCRSTSFVCFYRAYESSYFDFRILLHLSHVLSADFLHPSPSLHFKSIKSFYTFFPRGSCLCTIQHHTPYRCLYLPCLQYSVYFSSQKFSPFLERFFPIIINLLIISLWHLASVAIMLPR